MLTFVFEMTPVQNATCMHLVVTCPKRELLDQAAWIAHQDMVGQAVFNNVIVGARAAGRHQLRCVSMRPWPEVLNEHLALKRAIDTGSHTLPGNMDVQFTKLEPTHIIVTYSIEEHRVAEWKPEIFAN